MSIVPDTHRTSDTYTVREAAPAWGCPTTACTSTTGLHGGLPGGAAHPAPQGRGGAPGGGPGASPRRRTRCPSPRGCTRWTCCWRRRTGCRRGPGGSWCSGCWTGCGARLGRALMPARAWCSAVPGHRPSRPRFRGGGAVASCGGRTPVGRGYSRLPSPGRRVRRGDRGPAVPGLLPAALPERDAGNRHGDLIPEFEPGGARGGAPMVPDGERARSARAGGGRGTLVRALLLNTRWVGAEQHRACAASPSAPAGGGPGGGRGVRGAHQAPGGHSLVSRTGPWSGRRGREGGAHAKKTWLPLTAGTAVSGHGPTPAQRDKARLVASVPGTNGAGHTSFPDMPSYSLRDVCVLQGLPADFAASCPSPSTGSARSSATGCPSRWAWR